MLTTFPDETSAPELLAPQRVVQRHVQHVYSARDDQNSHGAFQWEQQVLDLIRKGRAQQLDRLLSSTASESRKRQGVLATDPLRHAKNTFICFASIVCRNAAIPGGMGIEQAYYLTDVYIQECEQLTTCAEVDMITYRMLMDFAVRMQHERLPHGVSGEVFQCVQFINKHLAESISVQDVADHAGRSRSCINRRFQAEMGQSVNQYISSCRMEEAKVLLRYTAKPLSEISTYLTFSSQSYFQNVFKRSFGITPAEYRRKHHVQDQERL